ncbi:glycoside hydrolase family 13 protein [Pseudoalteromonas aurantia]|uniref:Neopullulanase n=1 Tax=Pseudoalteromonas aurantia 208 TaxID=1314867 RepID=A0ABR9E979_9GAMM|nr:glycoside hydrolase family 13 protein [Pseudoalteromonas aurantia]MBE0367542.1 neopullulanase [Pseudoalteromonas aurantia 208]
MKQHLLVIVSVLLALSFTSRNVQALVFEPQNWWIGMAHQSLQILVREPNIKQANWQLIPYQGVSLVGVSRGDSNNYAFLNVEVSPQARSGELHFTYQLKGKSYEVTYPLYPRADNSAQRKGFSSKDVIYLINPDRFANGDIKNDTLLGMREAADPQSRGGRHGGDLQGIIDHLDYLQGMGFSQLWLTPVRENDMPSYSYHGYAITDFYRIDERMGSTDDYIELSVQAREKGLGLIMDMVLNHSGSEHWWVGDPPTNDWLNFGGKFSSTSHARQTVQDPNASEYDKKQFTDGWFVPTMPDLNQRQPLLANYLIQHAIWWIETANLSGIRVDTYSYSDKAFLAQWTRRIMNEYPEFNIVGEEWSADPAIASYWQAGKVNRDGYRSALPSVMDFSLQEALIKALNEPESWNTGWVRVYQSLANDFLYANPNNLLIFADNHDMSRVYTELGQDLAKTKLAITLLLTTRGIPQIYYGTEVLLDNTGSNDHGDIRIDFPGGFAGQIQDAKTQRGLNERQKTMQNYVRQLLQIRNSNTVLTEGKLIHFSPFDGIYSYARRNATDTILVLLNKQGRAVTVDPVRFQEVTKGSHTGHELLTQRPIRLNEMRSIPAHSAQLIHIKHTDK